MGVSVACIMYSYFFLSKPCNPDSNIYIVFSCSDNHYIPVLSESKFRS